MRLFPISLNGFMWTTLPLILSDHYPFAVIQNVTDGQTVRFALAHDFS